MKYITLSDLSNTIRKNLWKIPRDIDFIIGVPRSGMIVASIISDYLNVPLIDINSYLAGLQPYGGLRLENFQEKHQKTNKVLVVEDTVFAGTSMKSVKKRLTDAKKGHQYTYLCAYLEGKAINAVDIYLEDLRQYTNAKNPIVLYEWNIMQHSSDIMEKCLYDIDGVLCVEPPDERKEEEYLKYIKHATPLFIPTAKIGGLITYRLSKNRAITEQWLKENNVTYNELVMFEANSWNERNRKGIPSEVYKANYYKSHPKYILFVESSDYQAKRIHELTGKAVYSVEKNIMYS